MSQILTDIALIKQKSEFIDTKLMEIIAKMSDVEVKLTAKELLGKSDLESHALQDRWMFGLVIVLLVAILGKMVVQA